jgi:hypothetical protein
MKIYSPTHDINIPTKGNININTKVNNTNNNFGVKNNKDLSFNQ